MPEQSAAPLTRGDRRASPYKPVRAFYLAEALSSHASNFLMVGIFFSTTRLFGWGVKQNLMLACGQGAFYTVGALCAGPVSRRFSRRSMIVALQFILMALVLAALLFQRAEIVTPVLLLYSGFCAAVWPALESLVCVGADGGVLIKRLAAYNLVWSGMNALTLSISGTIIHHWPAGIFMLPIIAHGLTVLVMCFGGREIEKVATPEQAVHAEPEPELLHMRKQALWLSRIALPSTYVVIYSLTAMMPSLPVMQSLNTQLKTPISAVWFVARWFAFLVLGATTFWHTRPKLMLTATAIMLIAFLGITLRPSDLFPAAHLPRSIDLLVMIFWQLLLGVAMGIIYSASLYFGMVLSEGSTEHGGYHEALIGVGSVLGPGTAVIAQIISPGKIGLSVIAVGGLIVLSLAAAIAATIIAGRRERDF